MTQQYFSSNPESESREKLIWFDYRGHRIECLTDSGVFSKSGLDEGTQYLLDSIDETLSGEILDLGCGWGAVGTAIGVHWPDTHITFLDINPRALSLAEKNAARHNLRFTAILSDGLCDGSESYDAVLINPPIRAGKKTVYRLFADAAYHLKASGKLWVVIRRQQGAESAVKELKTLFSDVQIISRKKGYWVIVCRQS